MRDLSLVPQREVGGRLVVQPLDVAKYPMLAQSEPEGLGRVETRLPFSARS
jgi:hypothetical protein